MTPELRSLLSASLMGRRTSQLSIKLVITFLGVTYFFARCLWTRWIISNVGKICTITSWSEFCLRFARLFIFRFFTFLDHVDTLSMAVKLID